LFNNDNNNDDDNNNSIQTQQLKDHLQGTQKNMKRVCEGTKQNIKHMKNNKTKII
jgi:hypothetical protein